MGDQRSTEEDTSSRAVSFDIDRIPWEGSHPDGTKFVVLSGSRTPETIFTYAFFIPAGVWDEPHFHSGDAHVIVAKGQLRLGYGDTLDREAARAFDVGSFLFVPAHATHFDGAEVDTVILGTAVGPWTTTYASDAPDVS